MNNASSEKIVQEESPMMSKKKPEKSAKENPVADANANTVEVEESSQEKSELEKTSEELASSKEQLLRLAAEFENFKKANTREASLRLKYANENLLHSILPLLDNLQQAVLAGKNSSDAGTKNLVIGVEMVLGQFVEIMSRFGVKTIEAKGKKFDPNLHEAVMEKEVDDYEDGIVLEELQRGYLLHERLLRPARVVVSKKKVEKEIKEEGK